MKRRKSFKPFCSQIKCRELRTSLLAQEVRKNLPVYAGDMGSIPALGRFHVPQLLSLCSRTREPQLLSLSTTGVCAPQSQKVTTTQPKCRNCQSSTHLEPVLCNERGHHHEKPVHLSERVALALCNERKPEHRNENPVHPKINKEAQFILKNVESCQIPTFQLV